MGIPFEQAYEAHADRVYRYCLARTGNVHDAEDLVAEAFARYLVEAERVRTGRELAWLYAVARNLRSNERRRDARLELREIVPETGAEAEATLADEPLWNAVRSLPKRQQHVVYLKVLEDRTYADVARLLGTSEAAAKMSFHRAVRALRTRLPKSFDAPGVLLRAEGEA